MGGTGIEQFIEDAEETIEGRAKRHRPRILLSWWRNGEHHQSGNGIMDYVAVGLRVRVRENNDGDTEYNDGYQ